MPVADRQTLVRYGAAVSIGGLAGASRLSAEVPSLVAVVGVLAGVIIGLGVDAHRPVYHDAFAAAAAGTLLYAVILALGALTDNEPPVGLDAIRPLYEPLVFFPVFVLQALVVAVVVKRIRIWTVGDDTIEVP